MAVKKNMSITPDYESLVDSILKNCTDCGACKTACAFLAHYGTPKQILMERDVALPSHQIFAYECSLCGLCSAVCPEKLDPSSLFLELRRAYVSGGHFNTSDYKRILNYEAVGKSAMFSMTRLPAGCDAVFFPGCTLAGTRPGITKRMFSELSKEIPSIGLVLDCCSKPSHDLGLQDHFKSAFSGILSRLSEAGVKRVITGCANCHKIFREYGENLVVSSAFEYLKSYGNQMDTPENQLEITIHDPCAMRDETDAHEAVRKLLTDMGYKISEMKHRRRRTICCGEGGTVGVKRPEFADAWTALREKEAAGRPTAAYCAGCVGFLGRFTPAYHVADLLYRPEVLTNGKKAAASAPFTYVNRLILKQSFKRLINL